MLSAKILLDTLRVKNLLSLAINKLGAFFNQKVCIASFLISPLKHMLLLHIGNAPKEPFQ